MSLSNRNPYLFEHKQNHFFHLTQELLPELCQSHSAGGICLSLWGQHIQSCFLYAKVTSTNKMIIVLEA